MHDSKSDSWISISFQPHFHVIVNSWTIKYLYSCFFFRFCFRYCFFAVIPLNHQANANVFSSHEVENRIAESPYRKTLSKHKSNVEEQYGQLTRRVDESGKRPPLWLKIIIFQPFVVYVFYFIFSLSLSISLFLFIFFSYNFFEFEFGFAHTASGLLLCVSSHLNHSGIESQLCHHSVAINVVI